MIIDLTHRMHKGMPVYPGTEEPVFSQTNSIARDGFAELHLAMSTHTGTHIDAPSHILPDARPLSGFDISHFCGSATALDISGTDTITLGYLLTHIDTISRVDFVLLRTGWQHKWSSDEYLRGFPVLSIEAAAWLSAQNLRGVGTDTISIDAVESTELPNHHALLSQGTLIIENLTNLDRIHEKIFEFHCAPLHIDHADGSPVRAYCITAE